MSSELRFTLWSIGAVISLVLSVIVSITEGPRWAVGPLIGLTVLCCVGMINNASLEAAESRSRSGQTEKPREKLPSEREREEVTSR